MYTSEFCNFSYWWVFPIVMMVLCFLMMRGRRWRMICNRTGRFDTALDILDKRYASGEIDKIEYEEKKRTIAKTTELFQ